MKSPEYNDKTNTLEELVCMFWAYGFSKEEAEKMAAQSILNGDLDKNGVIDGNGKSISIHALFLMTWKSVTIGLNTVLKEFIRV